MENTLTTRQSHREYSFNHTYLDFLNKMIAEKQKQIRFRKWFHNQLKDYLLRFLKQKMKKMNQFRNMEEEFEKPLNSIKLFLKMI